MLLKNLWFRFFIQNKIKSLERFTKDINWHGNFNAPEAHYCFYFIDRQDGIVGEISGGMSPLHDTFYLFKIEVPLKHQQKHYEFSILANIAQLYRVPITPMYEIDRALLYKLNKFSYDYFQLNEQVSIGKMDEQKQKWNHLSEAIDRQQMETKKPMLSSWINFTGRMQVEEQK